MKYFQALVIFRDEKEAICIHMELGRDLVDNISNKNKYLLL
jgi:hypothetical protein